MSVVSQVSQAGQILNALKDGRGCRAIEALGEFGGFRLAARIHDLGKAGNNVIVEMVMANGKRHAVYRMAMPQRQERLF